MENKISSIRKQKNLTQLEVARQIGVAKSTYIGYETNYHKPTPETLDKIATLFEVSVDELLGRDSIQQLFDDARVPRPEILELYEQMTPAQQARLVAFAQGMLAASSSSNSEDISIRRLHT